MVRNSFIIFLITILISCNNQYSPVDDVNISLQNRKKNFGIDFSKDNLLSHFPERINSIELFQANPPACPPSYDCFAQFGDVVLIVKKSDYKNISDSIIEKEILFESDYSDTNIIINMSELKKELFPDKKCNNYYSGKIPIPFFESYEFGLGKKTDKKEIDGKVYYNNTYIIPSDLAVYVLQADAGNFWKEFCNEKRPTSLGIWSNGYSKGIAISEKEDLVVFWTMIW